ncbi:MAG TPA: hypothetical protein GXX40_09980 [Firmicutes bacterium]|nr:hypothetical protein [Bacillota bacterium]
MFIAVAFKGTAGGEIDLPELPEDPMESALGSRSVGGDGGVTKLDFRTAIIRRTWNRELSRKRSGKPEW